MSKKITTSFTFIIAAILLIALTSANKKTETISFDTNPKIQVAILLDVSNSMDGLIEQAKSQIWNMVNTLGKATCNGKTPEIEIALYEYGRSSNDPKKGYVKQINNLISDLDSLSENLFTLKTQGGDEYCGQVIYSALEEIKWDTSSTNYKVIFICGNEDFLQGKLHYKQACGLAKEKGVIVNTIYCGSRLQGINEHWNLNNECNNGSFTFINTNASIDDIPTPYDSVLYAMNTSLNKTYVSYGLRGVNSLSKQSKMDGVNSTLGAKTNAKRLKAKTNKAAYKNTDWDLVDAYEADSSFVHSKLDNNTLADSLKTKTKEEIKTIVIQKSKERILVQKQIIELNTKRDEFLVEEKKKKAANQTEQNLETEVEKIIKEQVLKFNMIIK